MRSSNPDLVYCNNNGVVAVKPTATGRLKLLIRHVLSTNEERVWVFIDPYTFQDDSGADLRIDHKSRGVSCGTRTEGDAFMELCRELDLTVLYAEFFVPFSNGQRRYATDGSGKPLADYSDDELKRMRWDLPNEARLRFFIENAATSGEVNA